MTRPSHLTSLAGSLTLAFAVALAPAAASAQEQQSTNPRFGKWLLQSENPPPAVNVMTYEAYGENGMRITVQSFSGSGDFSEWGYVTNFVAGEFHPVEGQNNSETAVEYVDERTTKITNRRNGQVTQVIMNRLTENGDTIHNEYIRMNEAGEATGSTFATYVRIPQGGRRGRGGS